MVLSCTPTAAEQPHRARLGALPVQTSKRVEDKREDWAHPGELQALVDARLSAA